ncbi:RNA polymerase sigma factor [Cedecea sp. FDAARGOS_727]|uniref:RNA polymerase sigma factor n=1 Tax=Cedecea sp. FDAARGOS_727 TaxID=2545798 RepID=UPI00143E669F|nr:sigma-70 family RNA polymerase sigma factor [Cedecea sp. FDAARGOS_727]QIX95287.1 sigma-70 family RNA polymerase sigma factor [Cedecea sp. FDAARGOS_727]
MTGTRSHKFEGIKITVNEVRLQLGLHLARLWRYGMVLSRNRDVAEDLVQSTCVRALERGDQFQSGTRIDRWLFAILYSIWINEIRALRVRQGQGFVDGDELSALADVESTEDRHQYHALLQQVSELPEAQRNTVFLVYVEGFSYQEAANTLAIPIGTVMSRLAAARLTLAKQLMPTMKKELK